jgi:endo-1,4-beta-xylanase
MFPSAVAFVALAASLASAATTPKTLAAAASPRYFGSALSIGHLNNASDPQYAYLASTQFNGVTPENEMKWFVSDTNLATQHVYSCIVQGDR